MRRNRERNGNDEGKKYQISFRWRFQLKIFLKKILLKLILLKNEFYIKFKSIVILKLFFIEQFSKEINKKIDIACEKDSKCICFFG